MDDLSGSIIDGRYAEQKVGREGGREGGREREREGGKRMDDLSGSIIDGRYAEQKVTEIMLNLKQLSKTWVINNKQKLENYTTLSVT